MKPIQIANLAQSGDKQSVYRYLQDIEKIPALTAEQESELSAQLLSADGAVREKAKEQLVRANLRLVVHQAKKYKYAGLAELIQAGNIGLIEAANRFESAKGAKFSTYAMPWITKYLLKVVEEFRSHQWEQGLQKPTKFAGSSVPITRPSNRHGPAVSRVPKVGRPREHRTLLSAIMWEIAWSDDDLSRQIGARGVRGASPRSVESWRLGQTKPTSLDILEALAFVFQRFTQDAKWLFEPPAGDAVYSSFANDEQDDRLEGGVVYDVRWLSDEDAATSMDIYPNDGHGYPDE